MNLIQIAILCFIILTSNFIWNRIFPINNSTTNNTLDTSKNNAQAQNNQKKTTLFFTFLAILPLLSGLYFINLWFKEYNTALETATWESCPGKILSKSVSNYKSAGITGHQASGKLYIPEIVYAFKYKDVTYKSSLIDYLNRPAHGDTKKSQSVLDLFPAAGESVTVYYNPATNKSVLITGAKNSNYFGLIGGGIFFIIGLIWIKFIYS